jgi:hypothetical protein
VVEVDVMFIMMHTLRGSDVKFDLIKWWDIEFELTSSLKIRNNFSSWINSKLIIILQTKREYVLSYLFNLNIEKR